MRCKGSRAAKSKTDTKDPSHPMLRGGSAGPSDLERASKSLKMIEQ